MEFKYFTKFTEDSFNKLLNEVEHKYKCSRYCITTYKLKEDLNIIGCNVTDKWLEHINLIDTNNKDIIQEMNYFEDFIHEEIWANMDNSYIRDKLINNNMYFLNPL
jgi:hypothetical protein